mgnify:CR=1
MRRISALISVPDFIAPIPPKLRPEIGKSTQFVTICHYFGKFPLPKWVLQRKELAVRGGFEPESERFLLGAQMHTMARNA